MPMPIIGETSLYKVVQSLRELWQRPVSGLSLLADGSVSNATQLDIVLKAYKAYRGLKFVLTELLPATDNVALHMRTSTDGGATFDSGASDYAWGETFANAVLGGSTGAAGASAANHIELGGGFSNVAGENANVELNLWNQASSAGFKHVDGSVTRVDSASVVTTSKIFGARLSQGDVDAVRFFFSSGNLSSKWAVYGWA